MEIDGNGTKQDPYKIKNIAHLQHINQDLDAHYVLVSNIDATNLKPEEFKPIGDDENAFTGTFDGNDCEIADLCIKHPEETCVGLFSCIGEEGRLRNLGLVNPTIESKSYVGSIASTNYGKIESSYVQGGDVSGSKYIGGLVGLNEGIIESSYVQGGDVSGSNYIGGLVSSNIGDIESSYTLRLDVSGEFGVGGFVTWNYSKIESSYAVGVDVSGEKEVDVLLPNKLGESQLESHCNVYYTSDDLNIPKNPDLELSRGNHKLSYVVDSNKLYIYVNDKIYSCSDVPPTQVQSLVDDIKGFELTTRFRASVVGEI